MADYESRLPTVTLRVVYEDLHLIEVEARVVAGAWSGITRAYTGAVSLEQAARGLMDWTARPCNECALDAGADTGIGWVSLRWYTVDRAGHVFCHVQIATTDESGRPEGVRRLGLEFPTEPALVGRFARQLVALAKSRTGEAVLAGS
jgi:hypothetical protein